MISTAITANSLPIGANKGSFDGLSASSKSLNIKGITDFSADSIDIGLDASWADLLANELLQDLPPTAFSGNRLPVDFAAQFAAWLENPENFPSNRSALQNLNLNGAQLEQLRQALSNQAKQGIEGSLSELSLASLDETRNLRTEVAFTDSLQMKQLVDRFGESLLKQQHSTEVSAQILAVKDFQSVLNSADGNRLPEVSVLSSTPMSQLSRLSTAGNQYQTLMTVETALQQPNWQEAFNSRVIMLARDQRQLAHIHINPPELGPVEIRMSLNSEQTHVQFISQHALVRDAIEEAFPKLREMMESSGLNLGDVDVSDQAASQSESFPANDPVPAVAGDQNAADDDSPVVATQSGPVQTSLVDHYV